MKVCGGKGVTGCMIAGVLEAVRTEGQDYRETMCAALGCFKHMASGMQDHPALLDKLAVGMRRGSDIFEPLMRMWRDMLRELKDTGAIDSYPALVSKEQWLEIKKDPTHPWHAYCGFGFGFKGVFFRSYFTYNDPRPACLKAIKRCVTSQIFASDYRDLAPIDELVYLDPVYRGRGKDMDHADKFDSDECWTIAHHWTLPAKFYERDDTVTYPRALIEAAATGRPWINGCGNTSLVSEYEAPNAWQPLASWPSLKSAGTKTRTGGSLTPKPPKYEHLFAHVSQRSTLVERALRRLRPGSRSHTAVMLATEVAK